MKSLEKEIAKEEKQVEKFFKNKTNIWMTISVVLAVIVLIMLIISLSSWSPKGRAANNLVTFLNEKTGGGVTLLSVTSMGSIYEVNVSYQGQEIPVYVTRDGDYFLAGAEKITSKSSGSTTKPTPPSTTIEKSDKPSTELFIWSYCPYGVTALSPFAEVAKVLGSSADFKVVLYYDGHGAYETQQNKIQVCIQKYDKAKYWDYAIQFAEKVYPKCGSTRTEDCDKTESVAIMKTLGIDSNKIMSCVSSEGTGLIGADRDRAQKIGVTGSPSFVIGDAVVQAGRNAEAYKSAVCSAFNKAPSACSGTMSTATATTSGSC